MYTYINDRKDPLIILIDKKLIVINANQKFEYKNLLSIPGLKVISPTYRVERTKKNGSIPTKN